MNTITRGDIIQITNPDNEWYSCLLIVDEVKGWGVQAYLYIPKSGDAYYRVANGEFTKVGEAILVNSDSD